MDTSNSSTAGRFKLSDLTSSHHTEDRQLATKARETINAVVASLKPVLRYLTVQVDCTDAALEVCNHPGSFASVADTRFALPLMDMPDSNRDYPRRLFVDREGNFFSASFCRGSGGHYHGVAFAETCTIGAVFFGDLIKALQEAFIQAQAKREVHLASIATRTAMLDRVIEAMKGSS